ncbi:hypothetical protein B7R25_01395 [Subtercola boreus]|uniref:Uncharacterized protein n=1 Tax=Subtercola boreus TaxID=120213 RepID=A0A3E0WEB4_9MICO|nr:hypothetical protein B7R24_01400 [Subtercola boreus]RFA23956.1 hypothetical protein B7R23_01400 [Subtercola boreus]RFA29654.1 hypothetical protein B7R25_01395 [Subtercola boreus]
MLRLNARESAIGSLIVSGTSAVAWETTDLIAGAAYADGGTEGTSVSTTGNRALVGYDGPDAIVSLRHLHRLRRALFIGAASGVIGVQLFDGSSFTVSTPNGSPLFVLSLLRVGNLIEFRAEPVTREATPAQLHREFGFSMTPHLTAREPRRR